MPPKVRISKDEIQRCALEIVRKNGADSLNARSLAKELGCSTQPIFSNYPNMDSLKNDVILKAYEIYSEYTQKIIKEDKYPKYKASGMAYISFAQKEKELFSLLFMRKRKKDEMTVEFDSGTKRNVSDATALEGREAELFHFEMWSFVHGLASMAATGFLEVEEEHLSEMLSDAFYGLKFRFERKEK